MSLENRQDRNNYTRAAYQNMNADDKQEKNSRRRARVQNMSPEEKQNMRAQRNAKLAARRNTPCIESIAMPRPDASNLAAPNHMSTTHPFAVGEPVASSHAPGPPSKAGHGLESDGNPPIFTLLDMSMCVQPVFTSYLTMQASTLVVPWAMEINRKSTSMRRNKATISEYT